MSRSSLKAVAARLLVKAGADRLFRCLNRRRLLVVMYHGITEKTYIPGIWTQLPVNLFRQQLTFLKQHYRLLHLDEVAASFRKRRPLPERAALITFDDGLRNNYTVAYPVLREMQVPAAIFLTVDFMGTDRVFWFDELFFLVREAIRKGVDLPIAGGGDAAMDDNSNLFSIYSRIAERLKRMPQAERAERMHALHSQAPVDMTAHRADFGMLDWGQIDEMYRTGLIGFGVHTATHQILSELPRDAWRREIRVPRETLSRKLGAEVHAFCYPNGRPNIDFSASHAAYLKACGYCAAFTTHSSLNPQSCDPFQIGRIPAGHDITSQKDYFRLTTSGLVNGLKKLT